MTNRYVIEGLLRDLVFREKDIIVVGPTWDAVLTNIFDPAVDRLQGRTGTYGYRIGRLSRSSGVVVTREGNSLRVLTAQAPRSIEGSRADIWVPYQIRTLGSRDSVEHGAAIRAHNAVVHEAQRNDAEIIHID